MPHALHIWFFSILSPKYVVSSTHCEDNYIVSYFLHPGAKYTMRLLSFRTGILKSMWVKEITLSLFSFRHTPLLTVHTDLHGHTSSRCLCRSRPFQWCLMCLIVWARLKLWIVFEGITSRAHGNIERQIGSENFPSSLNFIHYSYCIPIKIRWSSRNAMCGKT